MEPSDLDNGLNFLLTVDTANGDRLTRETANRADLLAWVSAHVEPADRLTLLIEARGTAVPAMLAALRAGLNR